MYSSRDSSVHNTAGVVIRQIVTSMFERLNIFVTTTGSFDWGEGKEAWQGQLPMQASDAYLLFQVSHFYSTKTISPNLFHHQIYFIPSPYNYSLFLHQIYFSTVCLFLKDVCFLTNGDPPAWLPTSLGLELPLGLELIETVLRSHPKVFIKVLV